MENFKKLQRKCFFGLTSKRHKTRKNDARKLKLEANWMKFSPLSFWSCNYVFILNGFSAMTSQTWVGDFVHLSGQHARKG